jgi:hypothetical protein
MIAVNPAGDDGQHQTESRHGKYDRHEADAHGNAV